MGSEWSPSFPPFFFGFGGGRWLLFRWRFRPVAFCQFLFQRNRFPVSFLDISNHFPNRDRFPFLFQNLFQHTGTGGGNFQRSFVGFEFDNALVLFHRVPRLFEPAADLDFLHGFANGGYFEFDGHDEIILLQVQRSPEQIFLLGFVLAFAAGGGAGGGGAGDDFKRITAEKPFAESSP